ncbi:MAG TPA: hypothetical protein DHV89_00090, partial [Ruminococcus sp.]|nr:hypothetical protein [Ruminococcus sp.]
CQRDNRNKKYRKPVFAENTGFFAHLRHSFSAKKRLNVLLYKKSYHKSRAVCYNIKKFIRINSFSADRSEHHGSVRRIT